MIEDAGKSQHVMFLYTRMDLLKKENLSEDDLEGYLRNYGDQAVSDMAENGGWGFSQKHNLQKTYSSNSYFFSHLNQPSVHYENESTPVRFTKDTLKTFLDMLEIKIEAALAKRAWLKEHEEKVRQKAESERVQVPPERNQKTQLKLITEIRSEIRSEISNNLKQYVSNWNRSIPSAHWTQVKALTRRLGKNWEDGYEFLQPVTEMHSAMSNAVKRYFDRAYAKKEIEQAKFTESASNMLAEKCQDELRRLSERRVWKTQIEPWLKAYEIRGVGQGGKRAQKVLSIIGEAAGYGPDEIAEEIAAIVERVERRFSFDRS